MAYTTIDNPELFFQTVLWTGNATNARSITLDGSENMQPDWVWIKNRTDTNSHALFDSVRGATKFIESDTTDAEATNSGFLQSFNSDGFTVGDQGRVNANSQNYVAWNWKAGGSASSNSDGDVTSSVSANTTAGFSIVKFTSASSSGAMTVGHGLGATPQVVIVKDIGATGNWQVYFEGIGTANQQYLKLNDTAALANHSGLWGAGMTSSVIGIGVGVAVDASESDIAYCFAEKKGYSKFGSYTGNGNADGTFVYTGFLPSFVMAKMSSSTGNWSIFDNKRSSFNVVDEMIKGNSSQAELANSSRKIDFNSSGFKIRANHADINTSGGTYIYMAFAESPFVTSTGIPTTAR